MVAKTAAPVASDLSVDVADLERRRQALYLRLEDGYQRIEHALQAGHDVTRWEEFWVQLLAEYESICDTLHAVNS